MVKKYGDLYLDTRRELLQTEDAQTAGMMARQLLTDGEPAGQVCRSCGFADYTSFYRAFKSEYGISPREFTAGNT